MLGTLELSSDILAATYWYCLSLTSLHPFATAQKNFDRILSTISPLSGMMKFDLNSSILSILKNLLLLFDDEISFVWDTADQTRTHLENLLYREKDSACRLISRILVLFMYGFRQLDECFLQPKHSTRKVRIRTLQALCVSFVLDMSVVVQTFIEQGSPAFHPLSVACVWLGQNMKALNGYVMWGNLTANESRNFEFKLQNFLNHLSNTCNSNSEFVSDFDGGIVLEEDCEIMGTSLFSRFFTRLEFSNTSDAESAWISRIFWFAQTFLKDSSINYLRFDEEQGTFYVLDAETRKKLLEKQSKILATERLKSHVETLERDLEALPENKDILIVSSDVLLDHLKQVRRWISSQSHVVLIAQAGLFDDVIPVIEELDSLKNTDNQGVKAREATRFILSKIKYKSKFLRVEMRHETALIKKISIVGGSPWYSGLLACCKYFSGLKSEVFLVTNNSELEEACAENQLKSKRVAKV